MNRSLTISLFVTAILTLSMNCNQSRPSEAEGRAVLQDQSPTTHKIIDFKKTDGQDFNEFGVQGYRMSYEATLECLSTGEVYCCFNRSRLSGDCGNLVKGGERV